MSAEQRRNEVRYANEVFEVIVSKAAAHVRHFGSQGIHLLKEFLEIFLLKFLGRKEALVASTVADYLSEVREVRGVQKVCW